MTTFRATLSPALLFLLGVFARLEFRVNALVERDANRVVLVNDAVENALHTTVRAHGLDDFAS